MRGLFSFLKPDHASYHHNRWIETREATKSAFDALPADLSGEMIACNLRIKTFLYPDKRTRDKAFVAMYGQERLETLRKRFKWRGLCVYHKFSKRTGRLLEAHLWVRYRRWKTKAIPSARILGHELWHALDKYQESIGEKDLAHPDKIKRIEWWRKDED